MCVVLVEMSGFFFLKIDFQTISRFLEIDFITRTGVVFVDFSFQSISFTLCGSTITVVVFIQKLNLKFIHKMILQALSLKNPKNCFISRNFLLFSKCSTRMFYKGTCQTENSSLSILKSSLMRTQRFLVPKTP